jgi:hypothetical protein
MTIANNTEQMKQFGYALACANTISDLLWFIIFILITHLYNQNSTKILNSMVCRRDGAYVPVFAHIQQNLVPASCILSRELPVVPVL